MKHILLISIVALLLAVPIRSQDLNRDSVPTVNVYKEVDEYVLFPGGTTSLRKFVEKNFVYPVEAWGDTLYKNISELQFIVRRDGVACGLDDTEMHPAVYKEWKRLFSMMPLWEPAKIKGYPVDVECRISIPPFNYASKLPYQIDRKMNYLKKRIDLNKRYNKRLNKEEAEELKKEMDEIIFYNPTLAEIFVPLANLYVSLNESDKAINVAENGVEGMYKQIERAIKDPYLKLRFDGKVYMDAVLNYALVCDVAGDNDLQREAYKYALNVIDERIFLKDIKRKKQDYGNEMYLRLMAEKQILAAGSVSPGVTLNSSERSAMFNHGWVSSKTMSAIDKKVEEGKIDNPRIRQINAQLREMVEERRKNPPMGKDSLYLYGLRAMVIDLSGGQDALNHYVDSMLQSESVGFKLKSYLSKLMKNRQKHAAVLENREAVVRSLAGYAPVNKEGDSKEERKQRAKEFYKYRDAMKAVYPLEWLWKQ